MVWVLNPERPRGFPSNPTWFSNVQVGNLSVPYLDIAKPTWDSMETHAAAPGLGTHTNGLLRI
jgi:hypothetical protein